MKVFRRTELLGLIEEIRLIPLFYHADANLMKSVVEALYNGGARLFEFTHRGSLATDVFHEIMIEAQTRWPGMAFGVGSVPDANTASAYMDMGASFIVTPSLREDIALVCNRRKIMWLPGCGTVTEINRAEELGCEIIKLFPASVYGPGFIKAVMAPQPWTRIMPSGGVTTDPDNLRSWFDAGAPCVGMGSKLITKEIIEGKNFGLLTEKTREVLHFIQSYFKP